MYVGTNIRNSYRRTYGIRPNDHNLVYGVRPKWPQSPYRILYGYGRIIRYKKIVHTRYNTAEREIIRRTSTLQLWATLHHVEIFHLQKRFQPQYKNHVLGDPTQKHGC